MWRKIMVFVTALKTQTNLQMCTQKTFQESATVSKSSYDLYLSFSCGSVGKESTLQADSLPSEPPSEVAQSYPTLANPWTLAHQALLSMGFPRQ